MHKGTPPSDQLFEQEFINVNLNQSYENKTGFSMQTNMATGYF